MEALIAILIPALITVESSGNNHAIGDNGMARGCLQIHKAYWIDGIEYMGVDWDYRTGSFNREKSIKVTKAYLTRYGKSYERRTGKKVTLEVLARNHNGGPRGYEKEATVKYWDKVKRELERKSK